jgi:hypothetical protein
MSSHLSSDTASMSGQLLLYLCAGRLEQAAVCWATEGPYWHVEVAVDEGHAVGAHSDGIVLHPLPIDLRLCVPVEIAPFTTPEGIKRGITWARGQVGKPYGWTDIAFQAVKFLAPNNPFRIGRVDSWDCSDFATRYLQQAGVVLPDMFNDPYSNTPNDLARIFGLLPPRKPEHAAAIPLLPFSQKQPQEGIHA